MQFQPKLNGGIEEFLKRDLNKFIAQIDVRLQNVPDENRDNGLAELPVRFLNFFQTLTKIFIFLV